MSKCASGVHKNDQISTQGLTFSRGEYNESSKSLCANENGVASSPNLEDIHRKKTLLIGHSSWCGMECNLLDLEGVFLVRGRVVASNPRETIMDDILGHDHVGLTILYCMETFQW